MTVEEIYDKGEISVRSLNLCGYNDLITVDDLINYYTTYDSFLNLRNCGRKSDEELIQVCVKYRELKRSEKDNSLKQPSLAAIILNFNRLQRDVTNSFIKVNSDNLSVRSKNGISKHLNGNFKLTNFAQKILLSESFKIRKIQNIGANSISQLENYIFKIKEFIVEISEFTDERELISLKNNFLIQQTFSISEIPIEISQSESIFKLTDFLLDRNAFFNENHTSIFKRALIIYQGAKHYTLGEIASETNLTRERVRQIRKDCLTDLHERLLFVKNFNDDLLWNYGLNTSLNMIEVKENLVTEINNKNKTNFSKEFISYILAIYLSDNFILIGAIEDVIIPKFSNSRNRHNWSNFYIINKELSKVDFISIADDINERIKERIEETYSFNFKSYLSRFTDDLGVDIIDTAASVAEKIVNEEFGLHIDLNDDIVFERNTIKQAFEYSYEALEQLRRPSKVEEITQKIIELHPNYETDENKVRTSLKRKDGFVPIGRNSIYGLKKWENENVDFKGGTIRSITIEFLEQFETPKHISLIAKYVSNYRENTYQRSIVDNLKADKSNTFIFFRQGFIGINSCKHLYDMKKYENLPVQFGKTLISLNRKGYSKQNLIDYIMWNHKLNEEESVAIINNLEIIV